MRFRKLVLFSLIICTVIISFIQSTKAANADTLDQHQDNHDGNNRSFNKSQVYLGELFTPTVTANITQFCINAYTSNGFTNGNFTVEIYATSSHLPTGSVLTSGSLSSASFPSVATSTKTCITLTSVSLTANTEYAAEFKSDINDGVRYYILQATASPSPSPAANDSSLYSLDGSTWNQNTSEWFAYAEYYSGSVTPTPTPTATPTPTPTLTPTLTPTSTPTPTPIPGTPFSSNLVISRNLPAYTSDDCGGTKPAANANNNNYDDYWRSCNATPSSSSPVTLTYDLSSVATDSRKNVLLAWYNDPITGAYDHTLISVNAYNIPRDYTIQANTASGGGSPPVSGWVTLTTVTGNVYHSRQHSLNLTTYNWVRMSVTQSEGSSLNFDVGLNMDIHNASNGISDDWIFFGDSITQQAFLHEDNYGGTFSQAINAYNSSYFPIYESGGIGGFLSSDGANNINTWLTLFPGKFVALNYGTNDANGLVSGTAFYNNMKTMVQAVVNAGKIPVIPKIPWGCTANISNDVTILNAKIDQLYIDFPQIIPGPDLYTYFNNHQSDISGDCIHPTDPGGYTDYLTQWVTTIKTAVYTIPTMTTTPAGGSYSSVQSVSLSASKTGTTIYYTIDGSTPTTSSTVYTSPITVGSTETLKAIAVDKAGNKSSISSNTYTFNNASSSSTSSSMAQSSNSVGASNPNVLSGWSKQIMAGPHFVGNSTFITGDGGAQAFVENNAVHDDANISIQIASLPELEDSLHPIPLPWSQQYNTLGDIYKFSIVSAFNGYPITSFEKPVIIILPFSQALLPKGQKPAIARYNSVSGRWEIVPNTTINWQNNTIATTVRQFSYFVPVYLKNTEQNTSSFSLPTPTILTKQYVPNLPKRKQSETIVKPDIPKKQNPQKKYCFLGICW